MIVKITESECKEYCGEYDIKEWVSFDGFDDQFNRKAVVILSKAVKVLLEEKNKHDN